MMKTKSLTTLTAITLILASGSPVLAQSHSHTGMGQKTAEPTKMKKTDHGNKAAGHQPMKMGDGAASKNPDTSTTKLSHHERYRVSIEPRKNPLTINAMHEWVLKLKTLDGKPVESADIAIDGGMPAHGHGLPTSPRVTEYLGAGRYLIEGMKFNMAGWWELKIAIRGHHKDSVKFNVIVK